MAIVAARACCGEPFGARLDRRRLLRSAVIAGLAASLPFDARAAEGDYEAMLVSCIDPRMVTPVYNYMEQRGLSGKYSQFVIAGAAIAVVAPKVRSMAAGVLGQPRNLGRAASPQAGDRDRSSRLRRRPDRLWRRQHRRPADRDQDPPRGPRRVPRSGREAPSATHRRDRSDGPRRLDPNVRLNGRRAPVRPTRRPSRLTRQVSLAAATGAASISHFPVTGLDPWAFSRRT